MVIRRSHGETGGLSVALAAVVVFVMGSLGVLVTRSLQTTLTITKLRSGETSSEQNLRRYSSLSCPSFLSQKRHEIADPNKDIPWNEYTRLTQNAPPFWISLHNEKFDSVRWYIWRKGYYYEKGLEKIWRDILSRAAPSTSRVIDVGANIGYYSLLTQSLGFRVDSFEPNPVNLLRFCQSIVKNGPETSVSIHPMGVAESPSTLQFVLKSKNPGANGFWPPEKGRYRGSAPTMDIRVVSLDEFARERGWFQNAPQIPILKIDVEGLETHVVMGAKELLRRRLVDNVLMEITVSDSRQALECTNALAVIAEAGYALAGQGGWQGPTNPPLPLWKKASGKDLARAIVDHVRTDPTMNQLNLWWSKA